MLFHKSFIILISLFFLFTSSSTLLAAGKYVQTVAGKYILTEKSTSSTIRCQQLWLAEDSFKCQKDGALYLYSTDMISTAKLNNTILYPFDRTVRLNDEILSTKDCKFIIKHLPGPLLLEKSVEAFLFAGQLYEHGQCVTKNSDRALSYYRKAGSAGRGKHLALKQAILAEEAKIYPERSAADTQDLVRNLQQASDIKRIKKEMQTKLCNSECKQSYSTHNKYRIEPQCFSDCMEVNGY